MVVFMSMVPRIRNAGRLWLLTAGVLLLSACWNWIPEDPAPAGQAPPEAIPSAATPSESPRQRTADAAAAGADGWYTVEAGDTLFSIAWRFRHPVSDLAAWNGLGDGSLILVDQRIRLTPPPGYAAPVSSPATRVSAGGAPAAQRGSSPGGAGTRASSPQGSPAPSSPPSRPASGATGWEWPTGGSLDVEGARARDGDYGIRILGTRGQDIMASDGGKIMYAGDGLKAYGLLVIVQHSPEWLSAYGHNERILVKEGDEVRAGQPIATMGVGPGNAAMLHFEIRRNGKPVEPVGLLPPRG
ncbi:MAG: peptidoglycan DD-metalloendopeptidase family protein [Gammaproteobacteria bacterium]|nr:peptidoglycan DD-metalloendopeptidase family protein [Gammaproteobacteria bacterium]MYF68163.1 peptidoglycan DD-metalloendopeptidase family protein [Gammaproteobacteria bacterium]MYK37431.1 peptidoglycan DD-metalloendopeptidase family protein [Gammaproteobacteria bacterium]